MEILVNLWARIFLVIFSLFLGFFLVRFRAKLKKELWLEDGAAVMIFVGGVIPVLLVKWLGFFSIVLGLFIIIFLSAGVSMDLGLSYGSGLSSSYTGGPSTNSKTARLFFLFLVSTTITTNFILASWIYYGSWLNSILFLISLIFGILCNLYWFTRKK